MYSRTELNDPLHSVSTLGSSCRKRQRVSLNGHFETVGYSRASQDAQYVQLQRECVQLEKTLRRYRAERDLARREHVLCHGAWKQQNRVVAELNERIDALVRQNACSDAAEAVDQVNYHQAVVEAWGGSPNSSADGTPSEQAGRRLACMVRELAAQKIREIAPSDAMTRYELCNRMGRSLDTKIGNGLETIVTMRGLYHKLPKDNLSMKAYTNTTTEPYNELGGKFADVANAVHTVECKTSIHSVTKGFLPTLLDGIRRRNNGQFTRKVRGTADAHPVPKYPAAWVVLFGASNERERDDAAFKLDTVAFWQDCGLDYFELEKVWEKRFALVEYEISRYFSR